MFIDITFFEYPIIFTIVYIVIFCHRNEYIHPHLVFKFYFYIFVFKFETRNFCRT